MKLNESVESESHFLVPLPSVIDKIVHASRVRFVKTEIFPRKQRAGIAFTPKRERIEIWTHQDIQGFNLDDVLKEV